MQNNESTQERARILIVDDTASNRKVLEAALLVAGYRVDSATSGREALDRVRSDPPDLILLDILMPGMDGIRVCSELRADSRFSRIPIVLVTALSATEKLVEGLGAGADDFIQKPINREELLARVRSLLRVKLLFDTVQAQEAELRELNESLERRVAEQTRHIARLDRLKRYVASSVADRIVRDDRLQVHRALIAAVCCDLRNFTAFALQADSSETIKFLDQYYGALGPLVMQHEGTIDHFTGDGMLVFFNDPVECDDPAYRAVRLAASMRAAVADLLGPWRDQGFDLGMGVGVTYGYATMGEVGFEQRREYAGTGTPVNLASRLSSLARDGEILITESVHAAVADRVVVDPVRELAVKGFPDPVPVRNLARVRDT